MHSNSENPTSREGIRAVSSTRRGGRSRVLALFCAAIGLIVAAFIAVAIDAPGANAAGPGSVTTSGDCTMQSFTADGLAGTGYELLINGGVDASGLITSNSFSKSFDNISPDGTDQSFQFSFTSQFPFSVDGTDATYDSTNAVYRGSSSEVDLGTCEPTSTDTPTGTPTNTGSSGSTSTAPGGGSSSTGSSGGSSTSSGPGGSGTPTGPVSSTTSTRPGGGSSTSTGTGSSGSTSTAPGGGTTSGTTGGSSYGIPPATSINRTSSAVTTTQPAVVVTDNNGAGTNGPVADTAVMGKSSTSSGAIVLSIVAGLLLLIGTSIGIKHRRRARPAHR